MFAFHLLFKKYCWIFKMDFLDFRKYPTRVESVTLHLHKTRYPTSYNAFTPPIFTSRSVLSTHISFVHFHTWYLLRPQNRLSYCNSKYLKCAKLDPSEDFISICRGAPIGPVSPLKFHEVFFYVFLCSVGCNICVIKIITIKFLFIRQRKWNTAEMYNKFLIVVSITLRIWNFF